MKKIGISVLLVIALMIIVGTNKIPDKEVLKQKEVNEQVDNLIVDEVVEEIVDKEQEIPVENKKVETTTKENETATSNSKIETITEEQTTTKSPNTSTFSASSNSKQETTTEQEKKTEETKKQEETSPPKQEEQTIVSVKFYESITHGIKEFASEDEALARGFEIVDNELDYVLDWNENNPDNTIKPEINYFRVYPSVIDENGKYWYYLHFFCVSGEGNDEMLKAKY